MNPRANEIFLLLEQKYYSLQEIANIFKTTLFDIRDDWKIIQKVAKENNYKIKKKPAYCRACGFQYKERSRIKTPTKCPRCKHESIVPMKFRIVF